MDLRDTPEEAAFRSEVRDWVEANLPERLQDRRGSAGRFEELGREGSRKLAEAGYAGLTWPKEYDGGVAPYPFQAIFLEELARADAPQHIGAIGPRRAPPPSNTGRRAEQRA